MLKSYENCRGVLWAFDWGRTNNLWNLVKCAEHRSQVRIPCSLTLTVVVWRGSDWDSNIFSINTNNFRCTLRFAIRWAVADAVRARVPKQHFAVHKLECQHITPNRKYCKCYRNFKINIWTSELILCCSRNGGWEKPHLENKYFVVCGVQHN